MLTTTKSRLLQEQTVVFVELASAVSSGKRTSVLEAAKAFATRVIGARKRDMAEHFAVLFAEFVNDELVSAARRALANPGGHELARFADMIVPVTGSLLAEVARGFRDPAAAAALEPILRRMLAASAAHWGEDHPNLASNLHTLAQLLRALKRYSEAEPLHRRALAIDEARFGPDHPTVARDLTGLALVLKATKRFDEAEPLLRRALAIDQSRLPPSPHDVARDLNNLGQLMHAAQRTGEAEELLRSAVSLAEKAYGPEHPDVAIGLINLARVLQRSEQRREAESMLVRAHRIAESRCGPSHQWTRAAARDLALLRSR